MRNRKKVRAVVGALVLGALVWSSRPAMVTDTFIEPFPASFAADGDLPAALNPGDGTGEKDALTAFPPGETWEDLGKFKLTFYCPCHTCSGEWGHQTSSGATCVEGITAACAILPPGTVVMIEGYGERIVQDTGGGVRGKHLDIFMESHRECNDHGIKYRNVWVKR